MLTPPYQAPEFTLQDQHKQLHSLADYLGKYVLVYFYPKDDTPGCTKEACMIRDIYTDFEKAGIIVLGISADSPESHEAFAKKYELPFTLLSDPMHDVIKRYGAQGALGTKRISYLIDPEGKIAEVYPKVDPASHASEILEDVKKIMV